MSLWSYIGLADKRMIDSLKEEITNLKAENIILVNQLQALLNALETSNTRNTENVLHEITNAKEQNNFLFQNIKEEIEKRSEKIEENIAVANQNIVEQILTCNKLIETSKNNLESNQKDLTKLLNSNFRDVYEKAEQIRKLILEQFQNESTLITQENKSIFDEIQRQTNEVICSINKLEKIMVASEAYTPENNRLIKDNLKQVDKLILISQGIASKADKADELQENFQSLAESVKNMWMIMKAIWVDSVLSDIDSIT